jgi:UDP-N-acetylglucosamine:LPS N-acetylglucosamine transferase
MARILLVSSAGGHLAQILSVAREIADQHECILCVTRFPAVRDATIDDVARVYYAPMLLGYQQPFGVALSMIAALWTFLRIFLKERPDVLISTGAEIAVPAFLVNRLLFRRPSLYLESVTRVSAPSLTGRLVSRLATRLFVQWPQLTDAYGPGRAEYHGRVL